MLKRFSAGFQWHIGIVHFFDASCMARNATLRADSLVGNTFRFLVAFRITLLSDYRVDAEVALRTSHTTQRADFPHWAVQSTFATCHRTALGRRGGSIEKRSFIRWNESHDNFAL